MMKPTTLNTALMVIGLGISSLTHATPSINASQALNNMISMENTDENRILIASEAARISNNTSRNLSTEDALTSSNKIYLSHNLSLTQEAIYHMEQLIPYGKYKDALRLENLKKLKRNKERFGRGEIAEATFKDNIEKQNRIYQTDLGDSENYLEEKGLRMESICANTAENNSAIQTNLEELGESTLPESYLKRMRKLQQIKTWKNYINNHDNGQHIRHAITQMPNIKDKPEFAANLAYCLDNLFSRYERPKTGKIWNNDSIKALR